MRVTVGISFLNSESTLADAVRSVFAQTFADWELILVDDGSSDRSLEIARAVRDERVRVFSDGMNRSVPFRLNQINKIARGEYIARMDGDDIMHPERLARQVEHLDANSEMDVLSNAIYTIDGAGRVTGIRCAEPLDASPRAALARGILVQGSAMGRAKWWRAHPYDESFPRAEENELWCRACGDTRFGKLPIPLYFCRENAKPPLAYLKDYLTSGRSLRRIYLRYGPRFVGRSETARLVSACYAKCGIYTLATLLGMQARLVNRRSFRLTEAQLAEAERALEIVRRTRAPGLD